ncbi:MAG: hypothetical protein EP330_15245 [Deltaproteobacteria bacterium]|nr:MAG: hypothetical protein EP330_15245 [Deltaproteobacteria bacterium]
MNGLDALATAMTDAGCAYTPGLVEPALCEAVVDAWLSGPCDTDASLRRQHTGQFEPHQRSADGFVLNPLLNPQDLTRWPEFAAACQAVLETSRLNAAARRLLGDGAELYQAAFFDSSPGSVPHRDDHPGHADGRMVAVLVALEPIVAEAGPFLAWPGTHALVDPELDRQGRELFERRFVRNEPAHELLARFQERLAAHLTDRQPVLATLPTGDGLWWTRRTVHGSMAPTAGSGRTRRSLITHFIAP